MMDRLEQGPALRFIGFNPPWHEVKLRAVSRLITKGTTPSAFATGGVRYVKIESLFDQSIDISKCMLISEAIHNKELKRSMLEENDILFAIAGATIGKCAIVKGSHLPANTNQALAIIRLNLTEVNLHYVFQILQSTKMARYIKDSISVGAQPNLNLEQMGSFSFSVPSLPEQQKIASFLTAVDDKIQLLSKKKALLEQYKKGVMQQLFSQKLRFKDDQGNEYPDWEEKTLGEISTIKRGASPRPISDTKWFSDKSSVGWVRISDVTKSNKYLVKTDQYLSAAGISKSRLVGKDNLIMSICATIGKPIYNSFEVCIHDGFVVFDKLTCDKEFLYYYLDMIQLSWYKYGQPGSQVNLNSDIVSNESVPQPSIKEQVKIASFLSTIDTKINGVTQQLEHTRQFKKGLLQQMFV